MKHTLVMTLILLSGCEIYDEGPPNDITWMDQETIAPMIALARDYFTPQNVAALDLIEVGVTDEDTATRICGCRCACLYWPRVVAISALNDGTVLDLCTQVTHEAGHAAAHILKGDWDYHHTLYPDYYSDYIFTACATLEAP